MTEKMTLIINIFRYAKKIVNIMDMIYLLKGQIMNAK